MKKLFMKDSKAFVHILLWATFIVMEVGLTYAIGVRFPWYRYATYYAIYISMFYVAVAIFLRYKKIGVLKVGLLIVAEIAVTTILLMHIQNLLLDAGKRMSFSEMISNKVYIGFFLRELFFMALSVTYFSTRIAYVKTKEASELLIEKLEAERSVTLLQNAYRASQIRPHLLLNTLHFMHADQTLAEKSTQTISILTNIVRYAFVETATDGRINLEAEIRQIQNQIALNKLRLEDNFQLISSIDIPEKDNTKKITPFLLVTLAENLFKHGDFSDPDNPAKISISFDGDVLVYQTYNRKNTVPIGDSTSLGMTHVRKILGTFYPGPQTYLKIDDAAESYSLTLKLKL